MNRVYGGVSGLRRSQMMNTSVALMRRSRFQQAVHLSAVSFPHREDSARMEVMAGHLGNWEGLLEGVLPNVSDVVEPLWRRRPLYVPRSPTNNRVQLTVRPVTFVTGQRPRQAVPQLTLER